MTSHDNSNASDLASKLDDDIDKFMEQLASERKSERGWRVRACSFGCTRRVLM
jgi:hypothetical protein